MGDLWGRVFICIIKQLFQDAASAAVLTHLMVSTDSQRGFALSCQTRDVPSNMLRVQRLHTVQAHPLQKGILD